MQPNGAIQMNNAIRRDLPTETEGKIFKTTDYSIFKGIIGNRGIYMPHLQRLITDIGEENMLPQNPIIVNERMEVIDGQHRLSAAKALGVAIYYVIKEGGSLSQVQMLNRNNRAWILEDYLESFMAQGKRDYIALAEFANEFNISVAIALSILADDYEHRTNTLKTFKEGNFEIRNYEKAANMASLLVEIRRHSPDQAWVDRDLMRALDEMVKKVDPKLFLQRLEKYSLAVTRRTSVKEYLREIEEIINFNQSVQIEL